ncbi:hypothetical protein ACIRPU_11640 [Streptomyces sp. NPDC102259]
MDDHDVDEVPRKALDRLTLPAEATSALWSTPDATRAWEEQERCC